MTIEAWDRAAALLHASHRLHGRKVVEVTPRSLELALADVTAALEETSLATSQRQWPPPGACPRPWEPQPQWMPEAVAPLLGWKAYTESAVQTLSKGEVEASQQAGWPPADATLHKLGVAGANHATWWGQLGLKPPSQWGVVGAVDLLATARLHNSANRSKAKALLDGGAHAASPWLPATLAAIDALMHSPNFWTKRKPDSFIRAFGGAYVLGQAAVAEGQRAKLKLIHGAPHTALTQMVCRAHSLIYTLIHLKPPVAPINTLIFGLNLRSAGFYYHQDSDVGCLPAKQAPLLPRQPVVTTVLYERAEDANKEVVLWQPVLNWEHDTRTVFKAARGLLTDHGTVHVQRAGLQVGARHGVFHAASKLKREGWRVALSARITHPADVTAARLEPFRVKGAYTAEWGPDGDYTLPPRDP